MFKKTLLAMIGLHSMTVIANPNIQLNVRADVYSEPVSIQAFTDGWQHPLDQKRSRAFAQGEITLGAENQQYRYGLLWRYDYLLSFTPDMASLYHQYATQDSILPNQKLNLALEANHIEAYGVYLEKAWQLSPEWQLWTGVSVLKGRHIVEGQFSGFVQSQTAVRDIDRIRLIQAGIGYVYDQPQLYEDELGWNPSAPEGEGVGLSVALRGQLSTNWSIKTEVRDPWGVLYWRNMPRTAYTLQFDDQKNPPHDLRGQLGLDRTYRQRLPWRADTQLLYQPTDRQWSVDLQVYANRTGELWQAGLYRTFDEQTIGLHLEPQTKSVGVSVKNRFFSLFYLTDDLNTNQAHRASINIQAQHAW